MTILKYSHQWAECWGRKTSQHGKAVPGGQCGSEGRWQLVGSVVIEEDEVAMMGSVMA